MKTEQELWIVYLKARANEARADLKEAQACFSKEAAWKAYNDCREDAEEAKSKWKRAEEAFKTCRSAKVACTQKTIAALAAWRQAFEGCR